MSTPFFFAHLLIGLWLFVLPTYSQNLPQYTFHELTQASTIDAPSFHLNHPTQHGLFRYDPACKLPEDSAMIIKVGSKKYVRVYDSLHPRFFGAVGDGKTDDTKSLQKCLDFAKAYQTIDFQGLPYNFSTLSLKFPNISLQGNGSLLMGTLQIGDQSTKEYNARIQNFHFATSKDAIQLLNVRKLDISNNTFAGNDKSIHIVEGPTKIHTNAMIEVNKNFFNNVNYCFYIARAPNASWMVTNDVTFEGNIANSALITAVFADGIDGMKYTNNVIFMPSGKASNKFKKHHLRIEKESDWVIVSNNNFFESGEESIYLENSKSANITGNNFAWSGQNGYFSTIRITGKVKGMLINVTDNIIDWFSRSAITVDQEVDASVNMVNNTIFYANEHSRYIGENTLSQLQHFTIETLGTRCRMKENNLLAFDPLPNFHSTSYKESSLATAEMTTRLSRPSLSKVMVVKKAKTPLYSLSSEQNSVNSYSGLVTITAKYKGTNVALYQLMIVKTAKTVLPELKLLHAMGLTEGKNNNHPSFQFSIEDNTLQLTPLGKTNDEFQFSVTLEGDLQLR